VKYLVMLLLVLSFGVQAALSPRTYNQLQDFQKTIDSNQEQDSLIELRGEVDAFLKDYKDNDLALGLALQIRAQINAKLEQPDQALLDIERAYKLKNLDDGTRRQLSISLAYLYFGVERFDDSIQVALGYLAGTDQPSPTLLALLANAYFAKEDYKSGTPYIERACELSEKPNAAWLSNALGGNYRIGRLDRALLFANLLVLNFPENQRYWEQRSGLYQAAEQFSDAASSGYLSLLQRHLVEDTDFYNLAVLLANEGVPFRGARILADQLESGVIKKSKKAYKLLAQSWLQAKEIERAKSVLAILFEQYDDAQSGITLLSYLVDDEEWKNASVLGDAITKLESISNVEMARTFLLVGIARFKLGEIKEAKIAFSQASKSKLYSQQANSWLGFLAAQSS